MGYRLAWSISPAGDRYKGAIILMNGFYPLDRRRPRALHPESCSEGSAILATIAVIGSYHISGARPLDPVRSLYAAEDRADPMEDLNIIPTCPLKGGPLVERRGGLGGLVVSSLFHP